MTTGVGRRGFIVIKGKHLPIGYWGRYSGSGVHSRIKGDETIFKMLILNVQKVLGVGLAVDLWREVPGSAFSEATPIAGITVAWVSHNTPSGNGTLTMAIVGDARNVTWTAPSGTTSIVVDVAAGGIFRLYSGESSIEVVVDPRALPATGGPFSDVVTFSRSLLHTPNYNPQLDQTTTTNSGYPLCSCYKHTSKQPDDACRSCYGTGIIPGYTKFGHTEYVAASTDPSLTLVNLALVTDFQPHRLGLLAGQTTGSLTTPDLTVLNPDGRRFEFRVDAYLRQAAGTSVTVEFSTDSGASYNAIADINDPTPTTGTIRFRVTIDRTLVTDKSPFFEILRARHSRMDEPFIRVLKGLPTRTRSRDGTGIVDSDGNLRWWTVPLRHFDDAIQQDPDVVVPPQDNVIQQRSFVEFREGSHAGVRFALTAFEWHDPKGIFISQGFSTRFLQPDEIENEVF